MNPPKPVGVDLQALRTIDHECVGCSVVKDCCCSKFDITVNKAEMKRIVQVLPEAAKLCPDLKTADGYANVFEETEDGLYSIDTHENDLCVFAYMNEGLIRCSLHSVEKKLGLPLGTAKPGVCILWPLTFTEDGSKLTLHDDAFACACSVKRGTPSETISPALMETIHHFGGGL